MNKTELLMDSPLILPSGEGASLDLMPLLSPEPRVNILLVDDRPDKLLALESLLAPLGQNIVKAKSGKEALRQLLKQDFAVILLDVLMPEMDGFETAAFIRQRWKSERTPIIFVTSLGSAEQDIGRGYSLGAVDFLLSPIVPEVLRAKVSVFVDLYRHTAEIRRLNRKLEERMVKLRDTVHELEAFSYSITHDMRAPLRAMRSFVTLLEEEYSACPTEHSTELFERIKGAASRMDRLIQDALDFSKVLREELPVQPVEVAHLLREMVATYPNLQPPQAEISIEFDELAVLGNEARLTQCFSNLLDNAVKFVAPGIKPSVRIWAEAKPPAQTDAPAGELSSNPLVRIWFEDNGIGMPREAEEKIFVMFQRLHGERDYPGTGIGLAIVAKAMQRMGGKVGVESQRGHGSRFWLELHTPTQPA